jgi:hypothetical protein
MIRPLILGGMVYGPTYLDIFERFCVASLRAPANLEALRSNGAKVVLCTTKEDAPRLTAILGDLPHELYELPCRPSPRTTIEAMEAPTPINAPSCSADVFQTLAGVQAGMVAYAAERNCAFHMLMPDQMYSARYFPNLFRLAAHGDVLHNGLNVRIDAYDAMDDHRFRSVGQSGYYIAASAADLGDIAWRFLHERMAAYPMNWAKVPTAMPPSHFHLWRARDRVMLFSPYNSPVYLTPETARRFPSGPVCTLDREIQKMVGEFIVPALEDDMVLIGIEHEAHKPAPYVDWTTFAENCWSEIGGEWARLAYYRKPTAEIPAAVLEGMPTAADVLSRQRVIADGLEEWAIVGEAA